MPHHRDEQAVPLRDHLQELRKRLTRVVLAVLVGTAVAAVFYEPILEFLMRPAQAYIGEDSGGQPIFTAPTEFIGVLMKTSVIVGLVGALPVLLYEVVMFVSPGLTSVERRYLYALLPVSLLAFAAGAAFGYLVLFPPAFKFLLTFGGDVATAMIRIGPLINMVMMLLLWMGVAFELPLVLFFLTKIGIVTPHKLARFRRYAVVMAFVLGAFITPTMDPINQALVAGPIIVLYEVGVWLSRLAYRGKVTRASPAVGSQ